MKLTTTFLSLTFLLSLSIANGQTYPAWGPAIDVTINGNPSDAMEPFISSDGNYLFFNNLNDGINTKLYYATKVNDSTFNYVGEVNGANQTVAPHLDAVPDMDSLNNFYWTSTRNYPVELDNLFHGTFSAGNVTNIGRVHGDFNMNTPGWLVMDHGISLDGEFLYYNNARFDGGNCQGVCETWLGVAQKINDSTFNKLPNTDIILQTINDSSFNYYAPCISSDDLELYYTRYPRDTVTPATVFDICVAVRNTPSDNFSIPQVLFSEPLADLIEAPTLTKDKQIMYYHQKTASSHKILMRYRDNSAGLESMANNNSSIKVYPNPTSQFINIEFENKENETNNSLGSMCIIIRSLEGTIVLKNEMFESTTIDLSNLSNGIYFVDVYLDDSQERSTFKIVKE